MPAFQSPSSSCFRTSQESNIPSGSHDPTSQIGTLNSSLDFNTVPNSNLPHTHSTQRNTHIPLRTRNNSTRPPSKTSNIRGPSSAWVEVAVGAAVGNPWEVAGSHTAEVVEVRILAAADIGLEVGRRTEAVAADTGVRCCSSLGWPFCAICLSCVLKGCD